MPTPSCCEVWAGRASRASGTVVSVPVVVPADRRLRGIGNPRRALTFSARVKAAARSDRFLNAVAGNSQSWEPFPEKRRNQVTTIKIPIDVYLSVEHADALV